MNNWMLTSLMLLSMAPCFAQEPATQVDTVNAIHAAHKLTADTYVFTDPNGRVTGKKGIMEGVPKGHHQDKLTGRSRRRGASLRQYCR